MIMTPLIDVTFLLILFFMLVNRIVAEERVKMIPPELQDAQTYELGEVDKVTVSVGPLPYDDSARAKMKPYRFEGQAAVVQVGIGATFDPMDLPSITAEIEKYVAANAEVEVLLRADAAIHYDSIAPVMKAISDAKVTKVHLVAYLPDKGPSDRPPPGN